MVDQQSDLTSSEPEEGVTMESDYPGAWYHFRLWRLSLWLMFAATGPATLLLPLILQPPKSYIAVGAAFVVVILLNIRLHLWRCPRCHNRFLYNGLARPSYANVFSRRCLHCGLLTRHPARHVGALGSPDDLTPDV